MSSPGRARFTLTYRAAVLEVRAEIRAGGDAAHTPLRTRRGRRPQVVCALERLPFADRAFERVRCIHALERSEDPAAACRELIRVAARGEIVCRRSWVEHVWPSDAHRWLVDYECRTLVFREKRPEECEDHLGLRARIGSVSDPRPRGEWSSPRGHALRQVTLRWERGFRFHVLPRAARDARVTDGPCPSPRRRSIAEQRREIVSELERRLGGHDAGTGRRRLEE